MNDWMKKLSDSGMEKHLETLLSGLSAENFKNVFQQAKKKEFNIEVIETHEYIFLKIPLSDGQNLEQLRVCYSFNKVYIDGIKNIDGRQTIILPALVKKKGASAHFLENLLEIKIPKHLEDQLVDIPLIPH